jgi:hypothetical protein
LASNRLLVALKPRRVRGFLFEEQDHEMVIARLANRYRSIWLCRDAWLYLAMPFYLSALPRFYLI